MAPRIGQYSEPIDLLLEVNGSELVENFLKNMTAEEFHKTVS